MMSTDILMSIKPKWCELIKTGEKIDEIRKTRPKGRVFPERVLIYQTENGGVIGEFTLRKLTFIQAWLDGDGTKHLGNTFGLRHCIPDHELFDYLYKETTPGKPYSGGWAWRIEDLIIYDKPKSLNLYGIKRPPQSWRYVDYEGGNKDEGDLRRNHHQRADRVGKEGQASDRG